MRHGVDVSAYQPSYDTDGLDFAFIKSSEGRSYVNPRLDAQAKRARDAECVVGFYDPLDRNVARRLRLGPDPARRGRPGPILTCA